MLHDSSQTTINDNKNPLLQFLFKDKDGKTLRFCLEKSKQKACVYLSHEDIDAFNKDDQVFRQIGNLPHYLITRDKNVAISILNSLTPLHLVVCLGRKDIVEYLVTQGAQIDAKTDSGYTPLHFAANYGYKEIVEFFLMKGVPIEIKGNEGYTPLHVAVWSGHKEIVEYLVMQGAQIDAVTDENWTALHVAAECGHKETVECLLKHGAVIDSRTNFKSTPLHFAAKYGHNKIIEYLLIKNAEIDATNDDGLTPLHIAAQFGQKEVVELLLEKKNNIEARINEGHTSLHLAAQDGQKEVVEFLLEKKANIEAGTNAGFTSLHLAAQDGHKEVVELLLEKKANIEAKTNEGYTPLHFAAQYGRKEVVGLLLEKKANIEAKIKAGFTSLHLAAHFGCKDIVEFLLMKGARIDALNEETHSLHFAVLGGHKDVVEILIDKMVNPHLIITRNLNLLEVAIQCSKEHKIEMVSFLSRYKDFLDLQRPYILHYLWHNVDEIIKNEMKELNSSRALYNILEVFSNSGDGYLCEKIIQTVINVIETKDFLPDLHKNSFQHIEGILTHKSKMENLRDFFSSVYEVESNKHIDSLNTVFSSAREQIIGMINDDDNQIVDLVNIVIGPTSGLGNVADTPAAVKLISYLDSESIKSLCLVRSCKPIEAEHTETDLLGLE